MYNKRLRMDLNGVFFGIYDNQVIVGIFYRRCKDNNKDYSTILI